MAPFRIPWTTLWLLGILLIRRNLTSAQEISTELVSESAILLEFKSKITDKTGLLIGWGTYEESGQDPNVPCGTNLTSWYGISCNTAGKVYWINLASASLSGNLNSSLAPLTKLKDLRYLNLNNNNFYGELPYFLGEIKQLVSLRLAGNLLRGDVDHRVPSTVRNLELQDNNFKGTMKLNHLPELLVLDLHGNSLTGEILDSFEWGKTIRYLDVSYNRFTGSLPSRFGQGFTKVSLPRNITKVHIDLSKNHFSGAIPRGLLNRFYVDLSQNNFSGSLPTPLNLRDTSYLNCSHNLLSGTFSIEPIATDTLTLTTDLDLSNNNLEGSISESIGQVTGLGSLWLHNNRFSGDINSILATTFPYLSILHLGDNRLSGNFTSELFSEKRWPRLQVLDLSGNQLEGRIPASLLQTSSLRQVRLQRNNFVGDIGWTGNSTWRSLDLNVLDLSHNHVSYSSALVEAILGTFLLLEELRLGHNIKNPVPQTLPHDFRAGSLEHLDLSHCGLQGIIPKEYSDVRLLPSLKYLDLSNNQLEGPVQEEFRNLTSLEHLDLSDNMLSGHIPDTFPVMLLKASFFDGNNLCGVPLKGCQKPLLGWEISIIVVGSVTISGSICLFIGWRWRKREVELIKGLLKQGKNDHRKDIELIQALLAKDAVTIMPLGKLQKATNNFSKENQIGEGAFGVVYKGIMEDGSTVAIKMSKTDGSATPDKSQFLNEIKVLSHLNHRNLVRLLGVCLANANAALLVFEFIPNGTLQDHLRRKRGEKSNPLSWDQRLQIAFQTADALNYLHASAEHPIYHLDVKSANILLDLNYNAKVADFGISKLVPASAVEGYLPVTREFMGTCGYVCPESLQTSILTDKNDVYAFGVVLLELVTAKAAVDRQRGENVNCNLVWWALPYLKDGQLKEIIDPYLLDTVLTLHGNKSVMEVAQLAKRCCNESTTDRPPMRDVRDELCNIQHKARY